MENSCLEMRYILVIKIAYEKKFELVPINLYEVALLSMSVCKVG